MQDQDGLTAEELAAEAGHEDIVSALKKHKLASTAPMNRVQRLGCKYISAILFMNSEYAAYVSNPQSIEP